MPMIALKGLRGQLLGTMAVLLVILLAIFAAYWQGEEANHREMLSLSQSATEQLSRSELRRRGEHIAAELSAHLVPMLQEGDATAINELVGDMVHHSNLRYLIVYDSNGRVLVSTDGLARSGQFMTDPLAAAVLQAGGRKEQWPNGLLEIAVPIEHSGHALGGLRVGLVYTGPDPGNAVIFEPIVRRLNANSLRHHLWIVVIVVVLLVVAGVYAVLLERRVFGPIRRLARLMQEDTPGSSQPLPELALRDDEIGELMQAFTRMRAGIAKHDREIRRLAFVDPLTGLANRLAFRQSLDDRLLTLRASHDELALLFIDLDDFKRVNDTLGHESGDEVLSQLSVRVRLVLEKFGAQAADIARFGGDEFIVLYLAKDIRAASARMAEALIVEIERPLAVGGRQVFLGASIGITLFPDDATHAGQLLKNADIAMYQAKVAGKNCYRFYSRALDRAVERRVQLEQDLRGAWSRGELSLVYQPIYRLADGNIVGAEALLRWQHPHLGMVPPVVFIEVAEQTGIIEDIGRAVLEQACKDAAQWSTTIAGKPFVSVNISPRQLRSGELPDVVSNALRSSGLIASQLHLELTETAVLVDEDQASALLSRVRATGVKVWLDDFGTGFSGLSHLRRVPVDGVKIDRSFVADLLRDPDDLALTTAIIAMAHSLSITVVAEGIESDGQCQILRERGCDQGQGFLFGRPMDAEEAARQFHA
jgi:diguanylate cyclase (GGDEF)-like protein